jgi:hypothetical protein
MKRHWYVNPKLDGIRWRQLELDLAALQKSGAAVVLFDAPLHPALTVGRSDSEMSQAQSEFARRLDELARRMNLPVLRYGNDWYSGFDAKEVYFDLAHVNFIGAHLLSQRVGEDLAALFRRGAIGEPYSVGTHAVSRR